ncbi:MAG: glycosyltransferase family 2 protein, partial [Actinomycetota bacterium]|nr:glycosyltransferase family 2 protein [Actinomycetota bacterium]
MTRAPAGTSRHSAPHVERAPTATVPVTVVVPVRNGVDFAAECLASVVANRPDEVIVVDGGSSDGTLDVVHQLGLTIVQDGGAGPAAARMVGARAARNGVVVLVDVDVVLPEGELARWYDAYVSGKWTGLQADLESESLERRYWGSSLAEHQRISRARWWFTLCATMIDRDALLTHGIDGTFSSGEDVEFRRRLQRAGLPVSVSREVRVRHRFRDGFADARHQWADDGAGLALNIRKNGLRDLPLVGIPLVGFTRGIWLSLLHRPRMLGYWFCYLFFNYVAMARGLLGTDPHGLIGNSRALAMTRALPMGLGFFTWAVAARSFPAADVGLAAAAFSAATLVSHLAVAGPGNALVLLAPSRPGSARRLARMASITVVAGSLVAGVLMAIAADRFAPSLGRLVAHPSGWVAFLVLVVAMSWAYLY